VKDYAPLQVLVVPLPSAESHTFVMLKIVQELEARDHEVLVSYISPHELLVLKCEGISLRTSNPPLMTNSSSSA
jgi:hypothetical protein